MTTSKLDLSIMPLDDEQISRIAASMPYWEEFSAEHHERVRIAAAQQYLLSPLYRKKAEALGMTEYFAQFTTSRVR